MHPSKKEASYAVWYINWQIQNLKEMTPPLKRHVENICNDVLHRIEKDTLMMPAVDMAATHVVRAALGMGL